jgi:hypothetical protein
MGPERDPAGPERPPSASGDDPLVQPLGPEGTGEPGPAPAQGPELRAGRSAGARSSQPLDSRNMLPQRERRRSRIERLVVRLVATCGIVGIGVAIAAILVSNKTQGWIVGVVVSVVSVVLAAILWSSREM